MWSVAEAERMCGQVLNGRQKYPRAHLEAVKNLQRCIDLTEEK